MSVSKTINNDLALNKQSNNWAVRETITEVWAPSGYSNDHKISGSPNILLVCPRLSSAALLHTPITTILSRPVAAAASCPVAVAPSCHVAVAPSLLSPPIVTWGR